MVTKTSVIKSFQEFVRIATAKSRDGWLFRGHESASWQLLPTIDRHRINGLSARMFETDLLVEFRHRVRPFISQEPSDLWEWLAIAQHHGLVTRLLDWTTNPLVGLYFAVEEDHHGGDSVVWCYRPKSRIIDLPGDPFDIYQITLYDPPHVSPRITPQSGLFTAHPPRLSSATVDDKHNWPGSLFRIEIPAEIRRDLRSTLTGLGVHRSALFPGLDGVGQFLTRTWKSWDDYGNISVQAGEEGEKGKYSERVKSLRDKRLGHVFYYEMNPKLGVLDRAIVAWDKDGRGVEQSVEILDDLKFLRKTATSTVRRIPPPILPAGLSKRHSG